MGTSASSTFGSLSRERRDGMEDRIRGYQSGERPWGVGANGQATRATGERGEAEPWPATTITSIRVTSVCFTYWAKHTTLSKQFISPL